MLLPVESFPTSLLTRNQVRTKSPVYKTHHITKFVLNKVNLTTHLLGVFCNVE